MNTKKLLNGFVRLRDELTKHGPNETWKVVRSLMVVVLRSYRAQIEYEKAKAKYDVRIEFFEGGTSLTEKDRKNIKEATAINTQIGKVLSELTKKKRK